MSFYPAMKKDKFLSQIPSNAYNLRSAPGRAYCWSEAITVGGEIMDVSITAYDYIWSGFGSPHDPKERTGTTFNLDGLGYAGACNPRARSAAQARRLFIRYIKRLQKNS